MHMQLFIILINAHPYIIGREQRYCFGNFQVELSGPKDFSVMVRFSGFYDLKAVTFYLGSALNQQCLLYLCGNFISNIVSSTSYMCTVQCY